MVEPTSDRYIDTTRRMTRASALGAAAISLLVIFACWGDWTKVAIVAGVQIALVPFNVWINFAIMPKRGALVAEPLRAFLNLASVTATGLFTDWPVPIWFWLPYVALVFDHFHRRVARLMPISFAAVLATAALLDGVHWIYPLSFTIFAALCSELYRVRFAIGRDLVHESDRQRREIATAHESIAAAHAQLQAEIAARKHVESELQQAQKLEAVGRLAAGIAHEINTPVQFVTDSVKFLKEANGDLLEMITNYHEAVGRLVSGDEPSKVAEETAKFEVELDREYLVENVPKAVQRSLEGLERIAAIVRSMKEFAHPDTKEMAAIDLARAIENTLVIARSEYKHVAELETEIAELPQVVCHAGEINQVVLNLLVNAAHAIADQVRDSDRRGTIRVRALRDGDEVVISISDSGGGIPEAIRDRIFEPFFTTKEVGRGTGQGLALARAAIHKHKGSIGFTSETGVGTTFTIRLPIEQPAAKRLSSAA